MNFLADECLYYFTTLLLRNNSHKVVTVQESGLAGCKNGEVLDFAIKNNLILITRDMHFSNILIFPPKSHHGIIVLKIRPERVSEVHATLLRFLKNSTQKSIDKTLIIVNHNKYRIRR